MKPKVLIPLETGFEEVEAITPIDLLRRAGAEVCTVAVGSSRAVEGKNGIVVEADRAMKEVDSDDFDLLLLPGGPAAKTLRTNATILEWARSFVAREAWIGAICAAPTILHEAGVLEGKRFTAHFSAADDLPETVDEPVVQDGKLITSQGAGTAVPFALRLIDVLFDAEQSAEIAKSICYDPSRF